MIGDTLPAVHSPLSVRALAAGAAAMVAPRRFDARIERIVRDRYGPRALLWTDSGTSALRLALEGVRETRSGPVALPAYCCYDVATAAVGAGVDVLLYDLDPTTLSPDPSSLDEALAKGAAAVVVAHLYGIPVDMDAVSALAKRHGALVIEDAAQGAGARWSDRPLGALGSLGILSFGRGKGVTGGRGGLLLGNDPEGERVVAAAADRLGRRRAGATSLAAARAQWLLARRGLYALPRALPWLELGKTVYRTPWPPAGLPRSAAGILSLTLAAGERAAEERRERARSLLARIGQGEGFRPVRPPEGSVPGFLRLPLLAPADGARAEIPAELGRLGVMPGYPAPLSSLAPLRSAMPGEAGAHPGARLLAERLVTLPVHSLVRDEDLSRMGAWLTSV